MSSSFEGLKERLTRDQLDLALYIYIGQNVRDEGILRNDPHLVQESEILRSLLDEGIVEESRWYQLDLLNISYRFTVEIGEVLRNRLQERKEELRSALRNVPENLLSFLVFDYVSLDLAFPVETEEWVFDWREVILRRKRVKDYTEAFFRILIDSQFCVVTNSYVSTRRGEIREKSYVINADVRKILEEITPKRSFPSSMQELAQIHKLIEDEIRFETKRTVDVIIKDEELEKRGSSPISIRKVLDSLLERLRSESTRVVYEITRTPGWGIGISASKDLLLQFLSKDLDEQIVKPLLSSKASMLFSSPEAFKEGPEINFLRRVQTLIDRKFSLYKTAAQFGGKEIFKSLPYIERCVIDLTNPLPGEDGLQRFVTSLHQVLEESSTKEVLKFREGESFTSLEEWLDTDIPQEARVYYEDAQNFFRDLNRLRNFYSHSIDAEGIFKTGLIFNRLIGKYSPEEEDILRTEAILLEKSTRSLESLDRALAMAWQKKVVV